MYDVNHNLLVLLIYDNHVTLLHGQTGKGPNNSSKKSLFPFHLFVCIFRTEWTKISVRGEIYNYSLESKILTITNSKV